MNKNILSIILILLWVIFVINNGKISKEGFNNSCPDILIEKDGILSLFVLYQPEVPGVNPIKFNGLDDYVEYLEWQRSQKINCPVLYLQHSYDAQGKGEYKQRPSPINVQGGLSPSLNKSNESLLVDGNRNNPPFNQNLYPGFDPHNQNIGLDTPLDKLFNQDYNGVSPNPMDTNWAGHDFTYGLIEKGYYKNNNVIMNKSRI